MAAQTSDTLASKLDRLFAVGRSARGSEYSYREVAAGIGRVGGAPISGTYIWQLRTGQRQNPSRKHIEGLAAFFGVPVNYFFNDVTTADVQSELELLVALRSSTVRRIAVRAAALSQQSLDVLATMVEYVRRLEGLPDQAASDHEERRSGKA
jgi:transcriptional regulator with XRE-family HTH domain